MERKVKAFDMAPVMKALAKSKYVIAVLLLGLVLILLPRGSDTTAAAEGDPLAATGVPLAEENRRLAELLTQITGVGRAQVLLSGNGAVVVCDGADSARLRLEITQAVSALTGLSSDKIAVVKRKGNS